MKHLLLMAALLPTTTLAHDWNQEYWLDRMLRNHQKIADCYDVLINEEDHVTFRSKCSLHSMGYTENSVITQYRSEKLQHPTMTDIEFIQEHFPDLRLKQVIDIWSNVDWIQTSLKSAIITMHIAEGLTRNDK